MEHDLDVKVLRAHLGLTQAQLADALGVDQSTVSNWERGSQPRGPARKLLLGLLTEADAIAIERATGGQMPRWRLRPDLWPQPAPVSEPAA